MALEDITLQAALTEAQKYKLFFKAFEKIEDALQKATKAESHEREIKARIAKWTVEDESLAEQVAAAKVTLKTQKEMAEACLAQAKASAERIVNEANQKAAEMVAKTKKDIEDITTRNQNAERDRRKAVETELVAFEAKLEDVKKRESETRARLELARNSIAQLAKL